MYSRTFKEARVAGVEKGEATGQELREMRRAVTIPSKAFLAPSAFTLGTVGRLWRILCQKGQDLTEVLEDSSWLLFSEQTVDM